MSPKAFVMLALLVGGFSWITYRFATYSDNATRELLCMLPFLC